jgi:hypothetical protein
MGREPYTINSYIRMVILVHIDWVSNRTVLVLYGISRTIDLLLYICQCIYKYHAVVGLLINRMNIKYN